MKHTRDIKICSYATQVKFHEKVKQKSKLNSKSQGVQWYEISTCDLFPFECVKKHHFRPGGIKVWIKTVLEQSL